MTEPQEPSISPAAARMRRHQKRRRDGLRCLTVQLRETEIEALIHKGLLHSCHHEASDKSWSLLTMQGLKLGTVALWTLAVAGTASAADLRRPAMPPPPPPVFNWTGCYIGGYVGGAWNERDAIFTDLGNSTFRAFSGGLVAGRLEGIHSYNVGLDSSSH